MNASNIVRSRCDGQLLPNLKLANNDNLTRTQLQIIWLKYLNLEQTLFVISTVTFKDLKGGR